MHKKKESYSVWIFIGFLISFFVIILLREIFFPSMLSYSNQVCLLLSLILLSAIISYFLYYKYRSIKFVNLEVDEIQVIYYKNKLFLNKNILHRNILYIEYKSATPKLTNYYYKIWEKNGDITVLPPDILPHDIFKMYCNSNNIVFKMQG